jgi:hypothetical protein
MPSNPTNNTDHCLPLLTEFTSPSNRSDATHTKQRQWHAKPNVTAVHGGTWFEFLLGHRVFSCSFPAPPGKCRDSISIMPQPLPFKSLPIHLATEQLMHIMKRSPSNAQHEKKRGNKRNYVTEDDRVTPEVRIKFWSGTWETTRENFIRVFCILLHVTTMQICPSLSTILLLSTEIYIYI